MSVLLKILILVFSLHHFVFAQTSTRKKTIDFEDAVVEGLNNSLDSLEQRADQDLFQSQHLYWKKMDFKKETKLNLFEIGYDPGRQK